MLHPLKEIAAASLLARKALYGEFCRQNKVAAMLSSGGNFQDLNALPGFTTQLTREVKKFFKRSDDLLSHNTQQNWNGYELNNGRFITNSTYKSDFCSHYPTMAICPYCDGEIGTPKLDHYLSKSHFPLLACSPWNLIPVCGSCNEVGAKGKRPAITLGPPLSTSD
ncbi:MAG: HNH endonuclease signature motif containing protein [Syntrophobacteraceae bacterium]